MSDVGTPDPRHPINSHSSKPGFMPEFAIGMTVLLIAAPVVLVGGTMWMALRKRIVHQRARSHPVDILPPGDSAPG